LKCELCQKTVQVNYGDAYHIFCQECSTKDTAQQTTKSNNCPSGNEIEGIDIPFRTTFIAIVAFSLILFLSYQLLKYFDGLLILTGLAAFVLISLVRSIVKHIYYRKIINDCTIAQSVKNKINTDLIFGISFITMSIISLALIGNQIKESCDYLLLEEYIYDVSQMFSPEFMSNLKNYAYNSVNIKLLITVSQVQDRLISLLNCFIFFVFGISQLYNGLCSDAISGIGILTRGKMIKWKEFASYSWSEYYEKQTFKNSTGYYDLELVHKNGKILTYILKKNESPISLKISAEDKDKVDKFLFNMITN
jgi:hypothetical protein